VNRNKLVLDEVVNIVVFERDVLGLVMHLSECFFSIIEELGLIFVKMCMKLGLFSAATKSETWLN
jgi:hypothetical protein